MGERERINMKRIIALCLLALILLPEMALASVPASLNQQMATRSGPGTKYTEELGTLPKSTPITVIAQVETGETVWYQVEYRSNGKLYRAYTGKKRVNTGSAIPWENTAYDEDTLTATVRPYYGPGEHYATRKQVSGNTPLRVFGVEGEWALCEYREGNKWARGYIHVDLLKNTTARPTAIPTLPPTPAPTPAPTATPLPARDYAFNIIDAEKCICADYYGNVYSYAGRTEDFALMVGLLPVMDYFDGVPCITRHTYVYSGPGSHYWRRYIPSIGDYAYTGTLDTNLRIYGKDAGWILIRYPSDSNSGYRYAWAPENAIPAADLARTPDVFFAQGLSAITTRRAAITDDPDASREQAGNALPPNTIVTPLAFLDTDRQWVYCAYWMEDKNGIQPARGFLDGDGLRIL